MTIETLKKKLAKYGTPLIVKEGVVFTALVKGKNLTKQSTVHMITKAVIDFAADRYPHIEAMVNDDDFFCIILKKDE